jgi:hypothetical protein
LPGEETYWNTVDKNDPEELKAYVKKFPQGYYLGLANLKLIKLGQFITSQKATPFDRYGYILPGDERARLDTFAIGLQDLPTAQGYLIGYAPAEGEAERRLNAAKDYLVNTRGIDAARLMTVDAGPKNESTIQLWVVPQGAIPPIP